MNSEKNCSLDISKILESDQPVVTISPLRPSLLKSLRNRSRSSSPDIAKKRKRGTAIEVEETSDVGTSSKRSASKKSSNSNDTRTLRRAAGNSRSNESKPENKYVVGQKLEARDEHGKWYAARVVKTQDDDVLIHFDYWSSRFDEWIDVSSERLRPVTEQQRIEKEGIYKLGSYVMAKWSQSKYYPARVMAVVDENRYHVLFYDGVEALVRKRQLRVMPQDEQRKIDDATFGKRSVTLDESTLRKAADTPKVTEETVSDGENSRDEIRNTMGLDEEAKNASESDEVAGKSLKKKEKFLTSTQKWLQRRIEERRSSQRKAAHGVALAVAQLTVTRRKSHNKPRNSKTTIGESIVSSNAPSNDGQTSNVEQQKVDESKEAEPNPTQDATRRLIPQETRRKRGQSGRIASVVEMTASGASNLQMSTRTKRTRIHAEEVERSTAREANETPNTELQSVPKETNETNDSSVSSIESSIETAPDFQNRSGLSSKTRIAYKYCKFKPGWLEEFEWLRFEDNAMFCEYCRQHYPNGKHGFVKGIADGFLLHRLSGHERTGTHAKAAHACGRRVESAKTPSKSNTADESSDSDTPLLCEVAGGDESTRGAETARKDFRKSQRTPDSAHGERNSERAQRLYHFWKSGRESWLRMGDEKFFCKACRVHNGILPAPTSLWNVGVPLSQSSNIRRHGQSSSHMAALRYMFESEKEGRPCVTPPAPDVPSDDAADLSPLVIAPSRLPKSGPCSETVKSSRGRPRKRKRSETSDTSYATESGSVSTITATETPASRQSSGDRKLADYQERTGHPSDGEGSRSSSLSHLAEDDVVRCVCETGGEDGLMLQCEQCMTWQHGVCVGIEASDAVSNYVCYVCKNAPGSRPSMRHRFETQKTWLETGTLPRFAWSSRDVSNKTKITQRTNMASRTVAMLNDRLRASRYLIHISRIPYGLSTVEKKTAMKNEILTMQDDVERELDALEPFVAELEAKVFPGRPPTSDSDFAQSKLTICNSMRELDNVRRLGNFLR